MRRYYDDPDVICLVGLDPGTTSYGVGIMEVRLPEWQICHVAGRTIVARPSYLDPLLIEMHGERYARLTHIGVELLDLFRTLGATEFAHERAFYNSRSPGAFGPLTEAILMTRNVIRQYDRHARLRTYSPMEVKASLKHGHSGKMEVAEALQSMLGQYAEEAITTWLDHSSDGLGLAKCLFDDIRER